MLLPGQVIISIDTKKFTRTHLDNPLIVHVYMNRNILNTLSMRMEQDKICLFIFKDNLLAKNHVAINLSSLFIVSMCTSSDL